MKIVSRKEAMERGLKRYFTGKPCRRGHLSERHIDRGCISCRSLRLREKPQRRKEIQAKYRKAHIKEVRAKSAAWAAANPERIYALHRNYVEKNREKYRAYTKSYQTRHPEKTKERYRAYKIIGSKNPTGELAWLRKCKVLLRTARRIAKKRARGVPLTSIEESAIAAMRST